MSDVNASILDRVGEKVSCHSRKSTEKHTDESFNRERGQNQWITAKVFQNNKSLYPVTKINEELYTQSGSKSITCLLLKHLPPSLVFFINRLSRLLYSKATSLLLVFTFHPSISSESVCTLSSLVQYTTTCCKYLSSSCHSLVKQPFARNLFP